MQKLWRAHARMNVSLNDHVCICNPQSKEIIETLNRLFISHITAYVRTYVQRCASIISMENTILSQNIRNGCVLICNPNVIYISGQRVLPYMYQPTQKSTHTSLGQHYPAPPNGSYTPPGAQGACTQKPAIYVHTSGLLIDFFFPSTLSKGVRYSVEHTLICP